MLDLIIVSPREQGGMNYIYIMEKKEYLSPEMKEVEIKGTVAMLAGSCAAISGVSTDKVDPDCTCPSDADACDVDD